jgi:hypothetical protein
MLPGFRLLSVLGGKSVVSVACLKSADDNRFTCGQELTDGVASVGHHKG